MRPAPIAEVVIYSSTALALLLLCIRKAGQVAIVVITPHQGDIIRHPQAALINLQHLLVRDEYLWHLLHILAIILLYEFPLVVDYLLQAVQLLLWCFHALHRTIMNASHAYSKEFFRALHLFQALCPVFLYCFAIGDIVICPTLLHLPFSHIIAQERLTMACAYQNAEGIGHFFVSLYCEEARTDIMHSRPDDVGTQSQHQFEESLIGLWSHIVLRPLADAPVFVIDEDATILNRRGLFHAKIIWQRQLVFAMRSYITPPYPRRNTCHPAQFQQAVGSTSGIVSFHHYLPVFHTDAEAVIAALALHNADSSILGGNSLLACHQFHITLKQTKSLQNNRGSLSLYMITHGIAAIIPHHISLHRQWAKARSQQPAAYGFNYLSHS